MTHRVAALLVAVTGLSGTTYPRGTEVVVTGRGASVDAFVGGDWIPLRWWEFAEGDPELSLTSGDSSVELGRVVGARSRRLAGFLRLAWAAGTP